MGRFKIRILSFATRSVLLLAAGTAPAWAQEVATDAAAADDMPVLSNEAAISDDAQAVLDRMTATLNSLQSFSISAEITRDELLPFGYKLQNNESARMWVERPNRLRLEVAGDIKNTTYLYDGKQLTMHSLDNNVYASTPAPDTIRELVAALLDAGVEMPLIDMLYQGTTGALAENVRVGIVVGESQVGGVATDHLAFRQPDVDWQLWVEKGARALPLKLVITTRYEVGDPQYSAVMRWDTKPRIDAKAFVFSAPAGASKVTFHSPIFPTGEAE